MNYQVALELKKAGFPQELENRIHYRQDCEHCMGNIHEKAMSLDLLDEFDISIPTLPELIDVLGQVGFRLFQELEGWTAGGYFNFGLGMEKEEVIYLAGKTPEEAVAKLWLALNTKAK